MRAEVRVRSTPSSYSSSETHSKVTRSFCGDAEIFLDQMLEQCHQKPKARHPGFGRELVPYFSGKIVATSHDQFSNVDRNAQASNKPICRSAGSGKSRSPRSPLSPRIAYGSSSRDQRNRVTTHETVAQEKSKKRNHGFGNRGSQVDHSIFSRRVGNKAGAMTFNFNKQQHSTVQTCRGAHHMVSNRLGGKVHSLFAGPGCFQSPSPESLPMPTAVMLAKALYPLPV